MKQTWLRIFFVQIGGFSKRIHVCQKNQNNKPQSDAEFKEFEPRLEFETQLKYSWFPLKLYSMFQDLSRHSNESGLWRI